jgi:hypothetical protein
MIPRACLIEILECEIVSDFASVWNVFRALSWNTTTTTTTTTTTIIIIIIIIKVTASVV